MSNYDDDNYDNDVKNYHHEGDHDKHDNVNNHHNHQNHNKHNLNCQPVQGQSMLE